MEHSRTMYFATARMRFFRLRSIAVALVGLVLLQKHFDAFKLAGFHGVVDSPSTVLPLRAVVCSLLQQQFKHVYKAVRSAIA